MPDREEKNIPGQWTELSYAGTSRVPVPVDPEAYSWPTFFIKKNHEGHFTDLMGNPLPFNIRHADTIDFEGKQLPLVKKIIENSTCEQVCITEYWNSGPPTKQWTPIIDRLIDTYDLSANLAARVLASVHAGINDSAVVTWYFKYKYNVPRPNQLDQSLKTIVCTPRHPSYPAGHGVIAGCAEKILTYFFSPEEPRLQELAEECAASRVYAGVHYPADVIEGLQLGRQIGSFIVSILDKQYDSLGGKVDYPVTENRYANLMPPPYRQVIKFKRGRQCSSLLDPRQCPEAR